MISLYLVISFKNDGKFSQKIFYRSINLYSNLWIILTSKYHNGEKAVDNLMRCSRQMGINIQKPEIKEIKKGYRWIKNIKK